MDKTKEQKPRKPRKAKKVNYKIGKDGSKKNLVVFGGIGSAILVFSAGLFILLSSMFSTETYYVLNENIKAKQQVTPEMVVSRETSKGTAPINALSMEEIQRGNVYSKYPLYAGDVVSRSNSGAISDITSGIPDDWSITSFTVNSTDAAGGILSKGDYADVLGIDSQIDKVDGSKYIAHNIMILEVKFMNEEYDGAAVEGQTVVGENIHYTVGMPAKDVALFQDAINGDYSTIKVIKTPMESNYQERDLEGLDKLFDFNNSTNPMDEYEGTDPTFTEVERDEEGRPVVPDEEVSEDDIDDTTETEETTEQ